MRSFFKTVAVFTFLILLISCTKDKNEQETPAFEGQLTNSTACKDFGTKSTFEFTADTISKIEYDYNSATHTLKLKHVNAGFNCCPGFISAKITLAEGVISICEQEEAALCRCECLYDLEFEITGVTQKAYRISLEEPYTRSMPKLEFDLNLLQETSGSFSVIRKTYPWGISVIN